MKRLLVVLLLALCAWATAQDALVFIRPEQAGPQIPREIDPHPIWVQWGPKADQNGLNRLLEPVTGHSWNVPTREFKLEIARGLPRLEAGAAWKERGILAARERTLGSRVGLLRLRPEAYSPDVSPLAATAEAVDLRPEPVVVAEADGWDEVARIARSHRRTAVLEYPPDEFSLGHLWLFGSEVWPEGIPRAGAVPGLVPARSVGTLLCDPRRLDWILQAVPAQRAWPWGQAFAESFPLVRIAIGFAFLLSFLFAVRVVATESPSGGAKIILKAAGLASYALLLSTIPARFLLGPEASLTAAILLLIVMLGIDSLGRKLAPWALASFLACAACHSHGEHWSVFSGEFGLLFGLYATAFIGSLMALPEPPSLWTWAGRALGLSLVLNLAAACPGGLPVGGLWLFASCLVCGEGWLLDRGRALLVLTVVGWMLGICRVPIFAWNGLLTTLEEAGRPNLYDAFATFIGPFFLSVVMIAFLLAIFASEYLRHRVRKALAVTPRLRGAWQLAGLSSPLFVLEPSISAAVPVVLAGAGAFTVLAALDA